MNLKYVSITGADDDVDPASLSDLSKEFHFAEWAILLMPEAAGKNRFPSPEWIKNFTRTSADTHKAMHLCGSAFLGFVNGDPAVFDLMKGFQRIQLNLKFGDVEGKYDPEQLIARVKDSPQWTFIIQYGHDKKGLLPLLADVPNHAVLFDESAGRGISPDSWDKPLTGHFCGYAGGLNPGNVQANIDMISKVAAGSTTWIDMETGVRTNDVFDLAKVRRVLEISEPYTK